MMTPFEITANAVTALSIFLAARNSVHTWWSGIIGGLLFIVVFYQAKLYADASLQIFFIVTSSTGWRVWLNRDTCAETIEAKIQRTNTTTHPLDVAGRHPDDAYLRKYLALLYRCLRPLYRFCSVRV